MNDWQRAHKRAAALRKLGPTPQRVHQWKSEVLRALGAKCAG